MLNAIKKYFEKNLGSDESADRDHQLKLATAALLIEMMQQDHQINETERQAVYSVIKKGFELTDSETQELIQLAEAEAKEAVDYFQFTNLIARECTQEEKIEIIENLWKIAYADEHLDALEEHMIRRITDLVYISHKDMIQAKHRVEETISQAGSSK